MTFACRIQRSVFFVVCAALSTAGVANAQSVAGASSPADNWSSSQAGLPQLAVSAEPPNPAASPAAARQDSGNYSGWRGQGLTHRLTWVAGGGFNAPIGNDTPFITWGGNFTAGGGVRFSREFSLLAEYQFMGNKLPGAFIAAADTACTAANGGTDCGITSGNAHINSITASPVIDLTPRWSNGVYLVGGWGWYHKSTNFGTPQLVSNGFSVGVVNVTLVSFTSNQWGANGGLGFYHRFGGMYGESHTQLFAESRYTFIHTPPLTQTNGFGTTGLIPVTLGVRF